MSKKALVVGSGAVGLRTAIELLRRNVSVVLRSPRHPLSGYYDAATRSDDAGNSKATTICSVGAGGLWMPVHCNDVRSDRWAIETLSELLPIGEDPDNELVEMLFAVDLKREHSGPDIATGSLFEKESKLPKWTEDPRIRFQHLTIEMLYWQNNLLNLRLPPTDPAGVGDCLHVAGTEYKFAWLWRTPVVNSPKMLQKYLFEIMTAKTIGKDSCAADVDVETGKEYESVDEMVEVARSEGCDAVFNCTGLGAAKIVHQSFSSMDDDDLVGGRGVTFRFDREDVTRLSGWDNSSNKSLNDCVIMTSEPPWAADETSPCYAIPRGDSIVVGGTMLIGDVEAELRESERRQLLLNAERLCGIDTSKCPPFAEWTGFRPYRPSGVRCEIDLNSNSDVRVIHNYGHGGSGWTINVGTAKEAVDLLFTSR